MLKFATNMAFVNGTPLETFVDPIREGLIAYSERTDTQVIFDIDAAMQLERTPNKPNSARSISAVTYLGKNIGNLAVIAFAPGDCTGDESAYNLDEVHTAPYPRKAGVLPRSKAAMHTEAYLPIAALRSESPNANLTQFAGALDLIGIETCGMFLRKVGQLGRTTRFYERLMEGNQTAYAGVEGATATTGYYDARGGKFALSEEINPLRRFGDPHAVYNATEDIQICAFLGITPETAKDSFWALAILGISTVRS